MKTLRTLVSIDIAFLALLGVGMVLVQQSFPVESANPEAQQYLVQATLRLLGSAVFGLAVVLLMTSDFALVGNPRRLALGLSFANGLIAGMAYVQQHAIWESRIGWFLVLIPLALAVALAWCGNRVRMEQLAETSSIPDEVRRSWLRQIGEAAAQEERNRLARDLHDSIKQQLFTINVSAAAAQELWERDPERVRATLADVRRSAKEAMVEMQALLHQLAPRALASAGLVEAVREQCEALGYRTGAEVKLELGEPIPDDRLPPGAQETLFRIAQEALSNVARHARARNVRVWLGRESEAVLLGVEDDGQGFEPGQEPTGMGLRNLKERAESLRGKLEVASAPGQGARIVVAIPLNPSPSETPLQKAFREAKSHYTGLCLAAGILLLGPRFYSEYVIWVVLLLISLLPSSRTLPDGPSESISLLRYQIYRNRTLSFLLAAWWAPWHWRLEEGWTPGRYAWLAAAVVSLVLSFREMGNFHLASRFRDPRQVVFPMWFRVTFLAILGTIFMGSFFAAVVHALDWRLGQIMIQSFREAFHFTRIQILFLILAGPVSFYFLTRQPRTEGAPT